MQVQYREVKGGFECLHAPSIDLSSVGGPAPNLNGHSHAASGSADSGPKRTVVRKSSKLSILRKGKEKEKDEEHSSSSGTAPNREKELPHRPISSAVAGTSNSSTYLNVPDAVTEDDDATPTATKEGSPIDQQPVEVSLEEESTSNHTLTREEQTPKATHPPILDAPNPNHGTIRPKHLPQVPRERSRSPPPAEARPMDKNDMSVRFDINIVKVIFRYQGYYGTTADTILPH